MNSSIYERLASLPVRLSNEELEKLRETLKSFPPTREFPECPEDGIVGNPPLHMEEVWSDMCTDVIGMHVEYNSESSALILGSLLGELFTVFPNLRTTPWEELIRTLVVKGNFSHGLFRSAVFDWRSPDDNFISRQWHGQIGDTPFTVEKVNSMTVRVVATDGAISAEEAAAMLDVNVRTLYKLAKNHEVPARKVGKQWRFNRQELRNWLTGKK